MKNAYSLFFAFILLYGTEWAQLESSTSATTEGRKSGLHEAHSPDIQRGLEQLEHSEYFIRYQENAKALQSPNRAINMRFTYKPDGFEVKPRVDSNSQWSIAFSIQGIYRGEKKILGASEKAREEISDNHLIYKLPGYEIEYLNNNEGMRQNFIVPEKPDGNEPLIVKMRIKAENLLLKCSDNELSGTQGGIIQYYYKDLKVFDAKGQTFEAIMQLQGDELALVVNDFGATYPLTIDPISTTASAMVEGNQVSARMGFSVAGAGDVNGDGYSDVIVGAPYYDKGETDEGVAFIYHGSAGGISTTAAAMLESNQVNGQMAWSVAGAGDLNGDGFSDVVVGAIGYDHGEENEGAVFVYYGSSIGISTIASALVESNQVNAYMGTSVAGAGDVNGDGFSDLIVGADYYSNGQSREGAAFLYHGSDSGISTTADWQVESNQANANMGWSTEGAGDVNGDGYSDVIVGIPYYSDGENEEGAAFLFYGSTGGISANAASKLEINQEYANFGSSVAGAGDVNGDGYSDVIVGAEVYSNEQFAEGAAFVYLGGSGGITTTAAAQVESNNVFASMGISVAGAGDVNGDGYSDVIVGAYGYDIRQGNEGAAFVYHGSATGISTTAATILESNQEYSQMAWSVSGAGDVNGDGYSDVIVGARNYDNGENNEGAAFVYHGSAASLSTTPALVVESNQAASSMGTSVAGAGDVNGDGYSDVIVGAAHYDNGQTDEGAVFIYHGTANGISTMAASMIESNQEYGWMGISVAGAGDVNGDGYGDVIVGAKYYNNGQEYEGVAFVYHGSANGVITTVGTIIECNQEYAEMGSSVAGAGDVNGDGFSDVIVGAPFYENLYMHEGAAFVYYGSASGIITTAVWQVTGNLIAAGMGNSVAGAGDVNGDGYSDVIVGASSYDNGQTDEGAAFIYHGSANGINSTAAWKVESNKDYAFMGTSVAGAGDVNGDGFSDVIVGSYKISNDVILEGVAFIYNGSAGGISTTASAMLENNNVNVRMGASVASAGDVNGDGYSDVIVGGNYTSFGQLTGGAAFIYHGNPDGIISKPAAALGNYMETFQLCTYVAGAGDVNGDGFSDVIVGTSFYDNGQTDEGAAFVYHGNAGTGVNRNLRTLNTGTNNPIQQSNLFASDFSIGILSRTFSGRAKTKLVWETKQQGQAFSSAGGSISNSISFTGQQEVYTLVDAAGTQLANIIAKPGKQTKVRVRLKYDLVTSINGQVYGPWQYLAEYTKGAQGMSSTPLRSASLSNLNTWLGITEDWNTASNWSLGVVPNSYTQVIINTGVPNMPTISGTQNTCGTLTLGNGATINLAKDAKLNITGN